MQGEGERVWGGEVRRGSGEGLGQRKGKGHYAKSIQRMVGSIAQYEIVFEGSKP